MPRLSRIRSGILEDLAHQLRFADEHAVVRHVERLIAFSASIDPDRAYDERLVRRALTGLPSVIESPAQLVGEALLGDLSAIAEHLSASANLDASMIRQPLVPLRELARRWGVSAKTLERERRRGLIGLRLRGPGARQSLYFPQASIDSFERRRGPGDRDRPEAKRLPASQRARMIKRARRYQRVLGLGLNQTAARLATRFGVTLEAARQVLRRHDERAEAPIFPTHSSSTVERRRSAFEAWRAGTPVPVLAKQFGRTSVSTARLIRERRADLLRRLDLPAAHAPDAGPEARRPRRDPAVPKTAAASAAPIETWSQWPRLDSVEAFLAEALSAPPPNAAQERALAGTLHRTLTSAATALAALPRFDPREAALDRIETDLRRAARYAAALVWAQRGVVARGLLSADDWPRLSEPAQQDRLRGALDAAARAVLRFDPDRGGRLAASISLAMGREPSSGPGIGPEQLEHWWMRLAPWQNWLELPTLALSRLESGALDDARRAAIEARFGLGGSMPQTALDVRSSLGVSPSRLAHWVSQLLRCDQSV